MKQINSHEELREYCLKRARGAKVVTYDNCKESSIILWKQKPAFENKMWGEKPHEHNYIKELNGLIELTFDCDFSKCCWEVK